MSSEDISDVVRRPGVSEIKQALVKADYVAGRLDITAARAYELAKIGLLPSIRLGRQVRFRPEDIEAFIERGGAALPGGWRQEPTEGIS